MTPRANGQREHNVTRDENGVYARVRVAIEGASTYNAEIRSRSPIETHINSLLLQIKEREPASGFAGVLQSTFVHLRCLDQSYRVRST